MYERLAILFQILFGLGLTSITLWIFTGSDSAGFLGLALMAPAFTICIAQAMAYIEGLTK